RAFRMPADLEAPAAVQAVLGGSAEPDDLGQLRVGELPRAAEAEPLVGLLDLGAVDGDLAEDAELVPDAVADGGDAERGQRVEEARRQPAEAAVAQPRLALPGGQGVAIEAQVGQHPAG